MRFNTKALFLTVFSVAIVVWGMLGIREMSTVRTGENVDHVSWLPNSASNISYFLSYSFTAYQFQITEFEFVDWCPEELSEITAPLTISTWQARMVDTPLPNSTTTAIEHEKLVREFESLTSVTVTNGLFYEKWYRNGGCSIYVFDRDSSVGYRQSSPR